MKPVLRNGTELAHDALVGLFKSTCEVYTTDDFMLLVATRTIPTALIDALANGVARHWSVLQGVGEPQVIAALREARPEVAEIVVSPQGREWVAFLAGKLTVLVPLRMVAQIFS